jgi:hypothetical protein
MFEEYEPTMDDVTWALRITGLIRDNGLLTMPTTRLIYKVSHSTRSLELQNPEDLEDEYTAQVHRRTIRVFEAIGWQVLVKEA